MTKWKKTYTSLSITRLTAHTIIRPQTGKFWLCIAKGNEQLLNSKFHQVVPTEDSTISRQPGPLTVNYIVKMSKQDKFSVFLMSHLLTVIATVWARLPWERDKSSGLILKLYLALNNKLQNTILKESSLQNLINVVGKEPQEAIVT